MQEEAPVSAEVTGRRMLMEEGITSPPRQGTERFQERDSGNWTVPSVLSSEVVRAGLHSSTP